MKIEYEKTDAILFERLAANTKGFALRMNQRKLSAQELIDQA